MCKLFSGFTQRGKVLASLINTMDKSLMATSWYFVNFAFSSCTRSGAVDGSAGLARAAAVGEDSVYTKHAWTFQVVPVVIAHSARHCLREIYLSSCWFWAVSFRTHAKGL